MVWMPLLCSMRNSNLFRPEKSISVNLAKLLYLKWKPHSRHSARVYLSKPTQTQKQPPNPKNPTLLLLYLCSSERFKCLNVTEIHQMLWRSTFLPSLLELSNNHCLHCLLTFMSCSPALMYQFGMTLVLPFSVCEHKAPGHFLMTLSLTVSRGLIQQWLWNSELEHSPLVWVWWAQALNKYLGGSGAFPCPRFLSCKVV
jgi:hypothetical protein